MTIAPSIPVSVIVMTKDEEANIGRCLSSLVRFDQVFVVDSGSVDRTQEIARAAGATVVEFAWNGGYPKKKQWSLENLPFRNDWVLYIDADEEVTSRLVEEIDGLARSGFDAAGYFVRVDYVFLGKRLRHGLRVYKLVLFDRRRGRYRPRDDLDVHNMWEVEGHYQPIIDGLVGTLESRIVHRDDTDLYHYFERHNRYSDWEAVMRRRGGIGNDDETQRGQRGMLKRAFDRAPFRPLVIFLYSFVFAAGFRDGRAGFHYAMSRGFYYWQIGLKMRELERPGGTSGRVPNRRRP
jgi:glycosyltransferase involved in cell wall biosynthesis